MGDEIVGTEHLLLGIFLEGEGPGSAILRDVGMTEESLRRALAQVRSSGLDYEASATGESMLKKYTRDLTALARDGKLDPVIGRDEEIKRVIQVLSRRTKNNPVLIGEPGVGKTAIAEGLAQKIVNGRRAGDPARPARAGAGPGRHGGRRQVPRRVRGAAQGRPGRDPALQGRGALHRRAAHRGRRRRGRGRHRRRQHDEADAGPRRAAVRRRHHARRVPQAHREGRGPGAALPAGPRGRAHRRGDGRHPRWACATSTRRTTR